MPTPPRVIVYYRARPGEPDVSSTALAIQHEVVASWCAEHQVTAIAAFTDAEADTNARPQLGRALAMCRKEQAPLLIAMTDPIGAGAPFRVNATNMMGDVPCLAITHRPAPLPKQPLTPVCRPTSLPGPPQPLPAAGPFESIPEKPYLYFDLGPNAGSQGRVISVFFCNPGSGPVRDVTVESFGARPSESLSTTTAQRGVTIVAPAICVEIDLYDEVIDGDFTTIYTVQYTDAEGVRHQGDVTIPTGGPSRRWWVPEQ